jgi:hypothetical protein
MGKIQVLAMPGYGWSRPLFSKEIQMIAFEIM